MNKKLEFYPKHPTDEKTHQIETTAMPSLEQSAPFSVKQLCNEFENDNHNFFAKYVDKRFEVTGIATKIGPDIHNKPSIEISDSINGQTYALVIFPTDDHYSKVSVGDRVTVCANYLVMSNLYGIVMKYSELVNVEKNESLSLSYPLFDGHTVYENACVVIENGKIKSINSVEKSENNYFLMPGLIDAHTHMDSMPQIESMLKNGITATCDVSAPISLKETSKQFKIIRSGGMTFGTLFGKSYVKKAMENGAEYIKVLLFEPNLMPKKAFKDICNTAHENMLKVAVHAISVKAVELAVECGADILIHVPMKEKFPEDLAKKISDKGIAVAPTLVMMETFANSGKNGYMPEHYENAKNAVNLLHSLGVEILAATDSNNGSFAPAVAYGTSMHREMNLLVEAGLTPSEVLASATSKVAEVFGIDNAGTISEGKPANLLLVKGRPDKNITDISKIEQVYIGENSIM